MSKKYGWLLRVKITPEDGSAVDLEKYRLDLKLQSDEAGLLPEECPELIQIPYEGPFKDKFADYYIIHFGADKDAADKFSDYIVKHKKVEE